MHHAESTVAPFEGRVVTAVERQQQNRVEALVTAWLGSFASANTQASYERDLREYLAWIDDRQADPMAARRFHIDAYARTLDETRLSTSSRGRKLAAVSSWYAYLVTEGLIEHNPAAGVRRPRTDRDYSPTVGLTNAEAHALVDAASAQGESARTRALVLTLLTLGFRIGSVLAADVNALGRDSGHRTFTITQKGGSKLRRTVPAQLGRALDAYLEERGNPTEGPLFVTDTGRRLDRPYVFRLIRRLARVAGIEAADSLSPHSLRHYATTEYLKDAPLHVVQDAMGHADPRTTRRYDRARHNLDNDPAYSLAARLAE